MVVQAAEVADLVGNYGNYGVQVGWLQAIATPAIDYFLGLPEEPGEPIDTMLVLFNMPINEATFTTEQLLLTDNNGDTVPTGSLTITSESFNNVLFRISGLLPLNGEDGTYKLTFNMTEIQGENGQIGVLDQSIEWTVCQIPLPIADAGNDDSVCTDQTYQLSGSVENATSFIWSGSGTGTFDNTQILTPVYTPSMEDIDNGSVQISLTAEPLNDCALAVSSSMELLIVAPPLANAGNDVEICEDFEPQLFGTVLNASDFIWISSGDGIFTNPLMLTPYYTPGNQDKELGSVELSLVAEPESPCDFVATSTIVLTIQRLPLANAGDDLTICENQQAQVLASADNYSSFFWLTTGDGTFDSRLIIDPVFTPGPLNIITGYADLALVVQPSDPCFLPAFSYLRIYIDRLPLAEIGADGTVCEDQEYLLSGNVFFESTFEWTSSGDGIFTNPQSLTPYYDPGPDDLINGSIEISLTAYPSGTCGLPDVASMVLSIQKLPESFAGPDATICENQSHQLSGVIQNAEESLWLTDGDGVFSDINVLNAIYTPGPGDITAGSVELNLAAASIVPCTILDISTTTLSIQYLPNALAGDDATICEEENYQLTGVVENAALFSWGSAGDGSFDNNQSLVAVYTPGPMDIQDGSIELMLTAEPIGPCTVSDISSMTIVIQRLPVVSAGDDGSVCHNGTYGLNGSIQNAQTVLWSSNGDGSFDEVSQLSASYTPGEGDELSGEAILTLTAEPVNPCLSWVSDAITLTVNYCQELILQSGWSGVSSFVEPVNGEPQVIFNDILDDLVILQSLSGLFWPAQNINTIGMWNYMEGYTIKVSDDINLTIAGSRSVNNIIQLNSGWNLIPVLSECLVNVEDVFAGKDVVIVKEVAGYNIFWPGFNINSLGNLQPGKSYLVLMNSDATLPFPECAPGASALQELVRPDIEEYLRITGWKAFEPTPNTHMIGIGKSLIGDDIIKSGDLLGVFDQLGHCYGVVMWDGRNTSIAISADDPTTMEKDGFTEDEDLSIRAFIATTGNEYDLEIGWSDDFPQSDGLFKKNGLSAIANLKLSSTGLIETGSIDALIYPNPAGDKVFIDFSKIEQVEVRIFDINGQEVLRKELNALRNQLDVSVLRSGVYLLKLEGKNLMKIERLVKQ